MNMKLIFLTTLIFFVINASDDGWEGFDDFPPKKTPVITENTKSEKQNKFDWADEKHDKDNWYGYDDFDKEEFVIKSEALVQTNKLDLTEEESGKDDSNNKVFTENQEKLQKFDNCKTINLLCKGYKKLDKKLDDIYFEIAHIAWVPFEESKDKACVSSTNNITWIKAPGNTDDQIRDFFKSHKNEFLAIDSALKITENTVKKMKKLTGHFEEKHVRIPNIELLFTTENGDVEIMDKPKLLNKEYDFEKIENIYSSFMDFGYCFKFYQKRHIFLMNLVSKVWNKLHEFEKMVNCCQ